MYLVRSSKVVRLACSPVSGCIWPPTIDRVSTEEALLWGVAHAKLPNGAIFSQATPYSADRESIEHGRLRLWLQKGIISSMSTKAPTTVN
jgi:hypothetical protein